MNKKELIEYIRAYYPEDQITFYDEAHQEKLTLKLIK